MSPAARTSTASAAAAKRIDVSGELKDLMRRLKLGKLLDALPERLALAATQHLPHHRLSGDAFWPTRSPAATGKPLNSAPARHT